MVGVILYNERGNKSKGCRQSETLNFLPHPDRCYKLLLIRSNSRIRRTKRDRLIDLVTQHIYIWSEVMELKPVSEALLGCVRLLKPLRVGKAASSAFPFCPPASAFEGLGLLCDNNSRALLLQWLSESPALLLTLQVGAGRSTLGPSRPQSTSPRLLLQLSLLLSSKATPGFLQPSSALAGL